MNNAYEYAQTHTLDFRSQLVEWLRIPSISTDSAYQAEVVRAAEWLAADMRRIGLSHVEVIPTGGHPVVYGEWLGAGEDAPTVLIYGHYDVQPAELSDGWTHEPFEPQIRNDRIYARGANDDKGQVMVQMKALESMLATQMCPVNVKCLIEGEEEIGSPHLAAFVKTHMEKLKADVCVISDTRIYSLEQPMIVYGLRGLASLELIVSGPKKDLHSGYGGIIHNPAQAIAEIVAKLHHEDGRVSVPHFYDEVEELSTEEREMLATGEIDAEEWALMFGDVPEWGERGYLKTERVGARPTLEINGISGGYTGEGFKTVIPARAIAKISCRLVPNQDPKRIYDLVRDYILSIAPSTVRVQINPYDTGEPAITPIDHPAIQAAARAYAKHWGKDPIYQRGGGSIPIVAEFQRLLGLPVVLLGFGLPDGNSHGPDESFHLLMLERGIATVISFMNDIAQTL